MLVPLWPVLGRVYGLRPSDLPDLSRSLIDRYLDDLAEMEHNQKG